VTRASYGREAVDRRSLVLEDEKLVKQVREANPRTIVVLISSFPYSVVWTQENVPAIIHVTHGSQELGNAVADVLFGYVNPAGRLVQTWPKTLDDLPALMDYDIRRGRTYMYSETEPLYPFGYGLSYTSFRYLDLRTSASALTADAPLAVAVDVNNSGPRAGDEVVQLYVRRPDSARVHPKRALKGFRRVHLAPGETRAVDFKLEASDLATWDPESRSFRVEPGPMELLVGGSSADIALRRTVTVGP
jgi:beta-glucosidase